MLRTEYELDRIIAGGYARGNIRLHEDRQNCSLSLLSSMENRMMANDIGALQEDAEGTSLLPGTGGSFVSSWSSYHNILCFDVTESGPTPLKNADQLICAVDEKGLGLFANLTKDISLEVVALHPTTCVVKFSHPFTVDTPPDDDNNFLNPHKNHHASNTAYQYYLAVGTQNGEVSIYSVPVDGILQFRSVQLLTRYRGVFSRLGCHALEWLNGNDFILACGSDGTARLLPREKVYEKPQDGQAEEDDIPRGRALITTFPSVKGGIIGAYFLNDKENPSVLVIAESRLISLWTKNPILSRFEVEKWKHSAQTMMSTENDELEIVEEVEATEKTPSRNDLVEHKWDRMWKGYLQSDLATPDEEKTTEEVLHGRVSSCAFSDSARILVVGLSSGILGIFRVDLESFSETNTFPVICLHVVSITAHPISSIELSSNGNFIAMGILRAQSLMVYDWRREIFIFSRQGHMSTKESFGMDSRNMISSIAYSSDTRHLLTGGNDGRIKVWDSETGKCIHTFLGSAVKTPSSKLSENTEQDYTPYIASGVISIISGDRTNGFYCLTSDGVIRGYDIEKAKCFRVFHVQEEVLVAEPTKVSENPEDKPKMVATTITVSPTFTCIALDQSEEVLIAATDFVGNSFDPLAGQKSSYYVYVFSTQTGMVMECLSSGHTAPITSINFHPSGIFFATTSWDESVIVWKLYGTKDDGNEFDFGPSNFGKAYEKNRLRPVIIERISLNTECLTVDFADDGKKMSVLTRDGEVYVIACERITPSSLNEEDQHMISDAAIEPWEIVTSWNVRKDAEGGWIQRSKTTPMVSTMRENNRNYYSSGNVNPIVKRDAHMAFFDCMRFTPTSNGLLLGGKNSRWIVFYHVTAGDGSTGTGGGILLKKWDVSTNRSISGNVELYPWRTRRGLDQNQRADVDPFIPNIEHLEEDRERQWLSTAKKRPDREESSGKRYSTQFHSHIHNRQTNEDENIGVHTILFSKNGDEWAAGTATGVMVFTLQHVRASRRHELRQSFNPLSSITPDCTVEEVRGTLNMLVSGKIDEADRVASHLRAITMAHTLREDALSRVSLLCVPSQTIQAVAGQIPVNILPDLLESLTSAFRDSFKGAADAGDAPDHFEKILTWIRIILLLHGQFMHKSPRYSAVTGMTIANRLQKLATLLGEFESFTNTVEENTGMLKFLLECPQTKPNSA